jgi:hypothetical protein
MAEQGHKNDIISDADEKIGQIADMIKDACEKFDSVNKRIDAMEETFKEMAKPGSEPKADDDDDDTKADAEESFKEWAKEEVKEPEHKKDSRKDARRKDEEECDDDLEVEEPGAPRETAADKRRKDAEEKEEGDHRVADSVRTEMATLRAEIAALNRRAPAMLSDMDRERFAVIQEQADPAFQAFGDRAPAPLDGETPTQYKRRLGAKLQSNSPKWATSRLSAVSDDAMLDTILTEVYSDSIAAARRGADVMPGQLREISRQSGGHIINEFVGEPVSWMSDFSGHARRA